MQPSRENLLMPSGADNVVSALGKFGLDKRSGEFFTQNDWFACDTMAKARRAMLPQSTDIEAYPVSVQQECEMVPDLHAGKLIGVLEAYVYFNVELSEWQHIHVRDLGRRVQEKLVTHPESTSSDLIVVWIPELSLRDIMSFLPKGFFKDGQTRALLQGELLLLDEVMQPGYRIFHTVIRAMEDIEKYPSITELIYIHAVLWLQAQERLGRNNWLIPCSYGRKYPDRLLCQFNGWSRDHADTLGFRVTPYNGSSGNPDEIYLTCDRLLLSTAD